MKKKLGYLLTIMIVIAAVEAAFSVLFNTALKRPLGTESRPGVSDAAGKNETGTDKDAEQGTIKVVASFYPIYVIALNLTDGVDGVELYNLTQNHSGCLHDYAMTTADRRILEQADVLLCNGGGMESFLDRVAEKLSKLTVVHSDEGIELLAGVEHHHDHGEDKEDTDRDDHDHDHEDGEIQNAHIWIDPVRYRQQICNLADGLIAADPAHRSQYEQNRDVYLKKVEEIYEAYCAAQLQMEDVIVFHEAFAYLGECLPLDIVALLAIEGEESALGAKELAEIVDECKLHGIRYLLVDETEIPAAAERIAQETGASVLGLHTMVSAPEAEETDRKDSWLNGMKENLKRLCEAE